ncbi:MAG: adenylate kinase [Phycisphaerae bacterium]|nr:adenylate kinase [Phycisphaerae bacterium]
MRIVLLGAPGAGKGTQCKKIIKKYGLKHLSSGDILRQERAEGTELGKKAQSYMDSGALVPDDLIVEMMAGAISEAGDVGFVLDGFPRTVNQAEKLDKALEAKKIDQVINLIIDDKIVMSRMTGRRSCPKCGAVYHVKNMPPKVAGKCDNDSAELIQRPDDTPQVVTKRLVTYHEQTKPVVGYYEKTNTVYDIDSGQDADQVSDVIFEKLDALVSA